MCKHNIASYDKRNLPHRNRPEKMRFLNIYSLISNALEMNEGAALPRTAKGSFFFALQWILCEA
jgi:hypothetical protein